MPITDELVVEDNDPLRRFCNQLFSLIALIESIEEQQLKERTRNDFVLSHIQRVVEESGRIILLCTYKRNDRYAAFAVPLFADIIQDSAESDSSNSSTANTGDIQNNNAASAMWIMNPLRMLSSGFKHFVNVALIALNAAKTEIVKYPSINHIPILSHVCIFALGIFYLFPITKLYNDHFSIKEELENIFAHALELIDQGYSIGAYNNIQALSFVHLRLLDPNFPGNQELRWKYYYVQSRIHEDPKFTYENTSFAQFSKNALEISMTEDHRQKVIRSIINNSDMRRKEEIYQVKKQDSRSLLTEQMLAEEASRAMQRHKERISAYAEMITTSESHTKLRKDLSEQLKAIVIDISECKTSEAVDKFNALVLDGYSKEAYPSLAVLYYQIEAALTLLGKRLKRHQYYTPHPYLENYFLCAEERILFLKHNLIKIAGFLEKCDPRYQKKNRDFIEYFEYTYGLIFGDKTVEMNPPFVPGWVRQKDVFIDKSFEKLDQGMLKRSSSMSDMVEAEKMLASRHRSVTI